MKETITSTTETARQIVGPAGGDYELYGDWDGASIDLQILTLNGDWETLATHTEDTLDATIESNRWREYRFKASAVGGSTSIKSAIGPAN